MSDVATSPGATVSGPPPGVPGAGSGSQRVATGEACPLCGSPLRPEQEWCLRCGAAARTRLAATPNWRAPIAAIVAVVALSLGALTAALVDLAGNSTPTRIQVTRTVTTAPAAALPAPTTSTATPTPTAGAVSRTAPPTATPGSTRSGAQTTTTPVTGGAVPPASGRTSTGSIIPGVTQPGTPGPPSRK